MKTILLAFALLTTVAFGQASKLSAAADVHEPAANTAAVVTYAAVSANSSHVISGIAWSYEGTGTLSGGNLTVSAGATTVFTIGITSKGAGFIPFQFPKKIAPNTALVVTLAAGGADVTGKVSVMNHWTE